MRRLLTILLTLTLALSTLTFGAQVAGSARVTPSDSDVSKMVNLAQQFLSRRSVSLTRRGAAAAVAVPSSAVAHGSPEFLDLEAVAVDELAARRDVLREFGEEYLEAETSLTLLGVEPGAGTVIIRVEERSSLTYAKIHGDEPSHTAFVVPRLLSFRREGAAWVLEAMPIESGGPAPLTEPTGVSGAEMRSALAASTAGPDPQRATDLVTPEAIDPGDKAGPYNYHAMANYAILYWDNYNPNYRTFNDVGGDCTNFISQAMYAGGWVQTNQPICWYQDDNCWWYTSAAQTWSWTSVSHWYTFAVVKRQRTYILSSPWSMWLADVLQVDFTNNGSKDHTMIVTYVATSTWTPYLTYHTYDTLNRSLSSLISQYPSARWYPHRT